MDAAQGIAPGSRVMVMEGARSYEGVYRFTRDGMCVVDLDKEADKKRKKDELPTQKLVPREALMLL